MSRRSSSEDAAPDVYVALLFASLAALATGIVLLMVELGSYSNQLSGG